MWFWLHLSCGKSNNYCQIRLPLRHQSLRLRSKTCSQIPIVVIRLFIVVHINTKTIISCFGYNSFLTMAYRVFSSIGDASLYHNLCMYLADTSLAEQPRSSLAITANTQMLFVCLDWQSKLGRLVLHRLPLSTGTATSTQALPVKQEHAQRTHPILFVYIIMSS